uniref:Uncharacterized protein n=1 Tax=Strigamia maritima TaxID=126957 RepID=T1IUS8_STRMM
MCVKVKVKKGDGSNLDETTSVTTTNLFLSSLFSQVELSLNDCLVSSSSGNSYPYHAILETLLNFGHNAKNNQQQASGFFKDDSLAMNDVTVGGQKLRTALIKESRTWDLSGKLHCDLFNQPLYIINGLDLRLKMTRTSEQFYLLTSDANASFITKIIDVSLSVRRVTPTNTTLIVHSKLLQTTNVKYRIKRTEVKVFTIPQGNAQQTIENAMIGIRPKRVTLRMVKNSSFLGNYKKNPFAFEHNTLNYLAVQLDNQTYPSPPYQPNFETLKIAREHHRLFSNMGRFDRDSDIDITSTDFAGGYAIFPIDPTPNFNASDPNYFSLVKSSSIQIDIRFAHTLTTSTNLIVLAEYESIIEVDRMRQVHKSF